MKNSFSKLLLEVLSVFGHIGVYGLTSLEPMWGVRGSPHTLWPHGPPPSTPPAHFSEQILRNEISQGSWLAETESTGFWVSSLWVMKGGATASEELELQSQEVS